MEKLSPSISSKSGLNICCGVVIVMKKKWRKHVQCIRTSSEIFVTMRSEHEISGIRLTCRFPYVKHCRKKNHRDYVYHVTVAQSCKIFYLGNVADSAFALICQSVQRRSAYDSHKYAISERMYEHQLKTYIASKKKRICNNELHSGLCIFNNCHKNGTFNGFVNNSLYKACCCAAASLVSSASSNSGNSPTAW